MGVKFQYNKLKILYKTLLKKRVPINSDIVGKATKPFHYRVTFRNLTNYSAAVFNGNPLYYDNRAGGPAAHPLFPVRISWQMVERLDSLWDIKFPVDLSSHLIHQAEYIELIKPLKAGDELEVCGTLISLMPHKLGAKMAIRFDYTDNSGMELVKEYVSAILLGVKVTDEGRSIKKIAQIERFEIKEDYQSAKIEVSALDSYLYDGCSEIVNPIHTDRYYARSLGLPGIILQGTATLARSISSVINHLPNNDPRKITVVAGKFSGYVLPPDSLTVKFIKKSSDEYYFETVNSNNEYVIRGGYIKVK